MFIHGGIFPRKRQVSLEARNLPGMLVNHLIASLEFLKVVLTRPMIAHYKPLFVDQPYQYALG